MSADRKWHKGPPPHIGWWNASFGRREDAWRWWNGEWWSRDALPYYSGHEAAVFAERRAIALQRDIEWSDYYPENARVPRVAP